ncbi:hypothetical protein [Pragia fontium]|uniref:hypothetical protein n=1 Tax=Pragia fontium TaxID=82985 RepID=UPI0011875646|nr:hypothetical protein [Pragia fontium]
MSVKLNDSESFVHYQCRASINVGARGRAEGVGANALCTPAPSPPNPGRRWRLPSAFVRVNAPALILLFALLHKSHPNGPAQVLFKMANAI